MADENDLKVAQEIGAMKATLAHHGDTHTIILATVKEIRDNLTVISNNTNKAHERIDALESEAVTKKGVMKAALVVGGGSGLAGTGVFAFVKNILGIGAAQ